MSETYLSYHLKLRCSCISSKYQSLGYSRKSGRSSGLNIKNYRAEHSALAVPTTRNAVNHTYTSFLAISWSRLGRRLTLWLIARLRMCLGRVWKTRELEDFCETAFNMALISAARAWAKVDTGMKRTASEHDKQQKNQRRILHVNYGITPSTAVLLLDTKVSTVPVTEEISVLYISWSSQIWSRKYLYMNESESCLTNNSYLH